MKLPGKSSINNFIFSRVMPYFVVAVPIAASPFDYIA
jgi:hypothetical protein